MGWGSGIGVVALTTAAGGCAAFGLAAFLIKLLSISNFEGGSGYFTVFVTLAGLIGGFIVGLVTAVTVRSGFATAQLNALGIVAALTVAAGILAAVLQDDGPRLDGDKVVLEVELKCPRDWKPDNYARSELGSGCWLQRYPANGASETNPIVLGGLTLKTAPELDGQWVAACAVDLEKTASTRYLRVYAGHKTDVTIRVPLPRHPGPALMQWSQWSNSGFVPQAGKPAVPDYAFRFRVQRNTDYRAAHPSADAVFTEKRQKALAAMPADAPLVQWLPFFEIPSGSAVLNSESTRPEVQAVRAHPEELLPLLRPGDPAVVRRAVLAAANLEQVPASLIEPLAAGGRQTIELIHEARASSLPGDPDLVAEGAAYTFFSNWSTAMDHAGDTGIPARRKVLEEIAREVGGDVGRDGIHLIAEQVRKDLDKLGPAAQ